MKIKQFNGNSFDNEMVGDDLKIFSYLKIVLNIFLDISDFFKTLMIMFILRVLLTSFSR